MLVLRNQNKQTNKHFLYIFLKINKTEFDKEKGTKNTLMSPAATLWLRKYVGQGCDHSFMLCPTN